MLAAFGILWGLKEPMCAKPHPSPSHRLGLPPWAPGSHLPSEFCLSAMPSAEGVGWGGHFVMVKQQWQTLLSAPQHLLSLHPQYRTLIYGAKTFPSLPTVQGSQQEEGRMVP